MLLVSRFTKDLIFVIIYTMMVRDSSVGIATRYGLDGPGIGSRWGRDFPHSSRTALGPVPGVKRPGRGVDHLPHLAPRLKKE